MEPFLRKGWLVDAADEGGGENGKGRGGTEFYDEDDGVVYPGRDPRIAKGRKGRGVYAGEREGEAILMLRRNLFLLCARTEEECKWLSTVLAFAITTDPWRLEVDSARSAVGVTAGLM